MVPAGTESGPGLLQAREHVGCALGLELGEVGGELQAYADVVLHAADLAGQGDLVLAEGVRGLLVLGAVGLHLLAEADADPVRFRRVQPREDVDALLGEHGDDELGHGVLGGLGGEDADAAGLVVDVEVDARDVLEGALVVLRLEAQVALDEDEEAGGLAARVRADALDVLDHELELLLRVCAGRRVRNISEGAGGRARSLGRGWAG